VKELARLADCVTRARSAVLRDGYRRELDYAPEPEAPIRSAKVLLNLACGIAVAQEAREVGELQLLIVGRVAFDSIPGVRRRALTALRAGTIADDGAGGLTTSALAGVMRFSTKTMRRALEDLEALGVVDCTHAGLGRPDTWSLRREFRTVLWGAMVPMSQVPAPAEPGPFEFRLS
jgi:hypothetical protein